MVRKPSQSPQNVELSLVGSKAIHDTVPCNFTGSSPIRIDAIYMRIQSIAHLLSASQKALPIGALLSTTVAVICIVKHDVRPQSVNTLLLFPIFVSIISMAISAILYRIGVGQDLRGISVRGSSIQAEIMNAQDSGANISILIGFLIFHAITRLLLGYMLIAPITLIAIHIHGE